jgi:transposase
MMEVTFPPGSTVMRKLEIADADVMRIAIQQEIVRSEESRYDHRLHGLLLITGGQSCQQVAELFGEDRRTVQRWVKTFEQDGLDGLREGERPGRPRSLTPQQWKALEKDLRKSPDEFGLTGHLWDGKLLAEHLRQHYEVSLGVRQCQRVFKQMGFRFRKPRPQVAQSDPEAVKAFKKTPGAGKSRRR